MNTLQAAHILNLTDSRVRQLVRSRELRGVRVGRGYKFDADEVFAFRDARSAA
jgi:excisionase family DNA binding protein